MGYFFNQTGKLVYNPALVQHHFPGAVVTPTARATITTDNIRPSQLYVESTLPAEPGHLSTWTGEAAMFSSLGDRIENFSGDDGHEYALSKVEACDTNYSKAVAGVVIGVAAFPDDTSFLHRGVHSYHTIKNNEHILRLATPGAVVLAWVLDAHENSLDGVYTQFINGIEGDLFVIRELGEQHFSIERIGADGTTADMIESIDELTARLDELTQ